MHTAVAKNKRPLAVLMLVLTAILWSLAGILIKYVEWNPIAIAGTRSIIAVLFIYPFFIRKRKIRLSKPVILGAISYCATVTSFVAANKLTTAANAILLQYTAPLFVALFSFWLLKEKPLYLDWISIAIVLGGMFMFFLDDLTPGNLIGNILGIFSGLAFAFTAIFMRMQKNAKPIDSVFIGNILTGLISIPFIIGSSPGKEGWIVLVLLGVVQLAIPYILFSMAIKHVSALESLLIPIIEPILNPVWVFLIIAEVPGKWAMIGGAIVLMSILSRGFLIYRASGKSP